MQAEVGEEVVGLFRYLPGVQEVQEGEFGPEC